jgi:membrane protease YdiL (CAAX protease family)
MAVVALLPMPETLLHDLEQHFRNGSKPSLFLSAVLVAPAAEELFFRGILFSAFLARYSVGKAIWFSTTIFALLHLNPWQGIIALPTGIFFAWLVL